MLASVSSRFSDSKEALGGIEGNLIEDVMSILRLNTGVAQHQLADAGVALGQSGAHEAPQIMRFHAAQPKRRGYRA